MVQINIENNFGSFKEDFLKDTEITTFSANVADIYIEYVKARLLDEQTQIQRLIYAQLAALVQHQVNSK